MELTPQVITILGGALIGLVIGSIGRASRFCTFCAIRDAVNTGDNMRARSWALAVAVALVGVQLLQITEFIDLSETIYLSENFGWGGALIGGLVFGFGMALVGSCGFNVIIRAGAGDIKAIVAMLVMGLSAYMAARGLTGLARVALIDPLTLDWSDSDGQGLPAVAARFVELDVDTLRLAITALLGGGLALFALSDRLDRTSAEFLAPPVVIGLMAIAGFAVTGNLGVDDFEPQAVQSASFIMPTGNSLLYLLTFSGATINFGIALIGGTFIGSFFASAIRSDFTVQTFVNSGESYRILFGAFLMGTGGVTALGCTFGQGITGVSTLSLSSFIATAAIIVGAILAMRAVKTG